MLRTGKLALRSAEADAVLPGGAVLDLPEGLDKVAGVGKTAFQPHLAGLEPGGAQQLGGFFHPELLDVLDGRDAQKLPEAAQTDIIPCLTLPNLLAP